MSVQCRPNVRRWSKHLRFPQPLHLLFKFCFIHTVLESLVPINEYNWDLFAIGLFQFRIRFDVDDAKSKAEAALHPLDYGFRVIAQMTARARIDLDLDGVTHGA